MLKIYTVAVVYSGHLIAPNLFLPLERCMNSEKNYHLCMTTGWK